ncbi:glycosyltransferase family 2 protein [Pseudohalioglobus sediminis]|uniref:Glycosyltransferase family 2 protein n=1 Tax=Pseudohalioglobus sediminis TaxID=2606449 RepID=A0A5B0X7F1_9GAMM|nr:glycosyltransferase family 2 protein [Pseudohalioglobus sediminis]KAA1194585.1 glycosyltransferase family 2 protein [Pseudohalioglobus sediminis]
MTRSEQTLSLCMIVKNESFFLRDCLRQAADHVDEIVVVDTGSSDDTRAIASEFTGQVFDYAWHDDFAAARNHALSQASGDWIIVLDADEVIAPDDWLTLRELIRDPDYDAYFLVQYNYSVEPLDRNWVPISEPTPYTRHYRGYRPNPIARLFRNCEDIRYQGRVHEVVDRTLPAGRFRSVDIPIHHHMDEDPAKRKVDRQLNYLRIIEQQLEGEDDGRLWTAAGTICLYYADDLPKGIRYLQRAVELGYRADENREYIAEAQYRLGELGQAYNGYLALYRAGYRSLNLCNNLANLAVKRDEFGFAADLLEAALQQGVADYQVRLRLEHNIRYLRERQNGAG